MNNTRNSTMCFVVIDLEGDQMMKHIGNIHIKQYENNSSVSEPVLVLHFFGILTHIPVMCKVKLNFSL
jgi:extradiol dioxygenase family protein